MAWGERATIRRASNEGHSCLAKTRLVIVENHIHLLINLHPSVRLSDLVRDIKLSTSQWIKQNRDLFPQFAGWGKEYGAFTYALRDKEMVANYIKNQRVHHQRESFEDEYRKHLLNAGIEWNDYRLT